MAKAAKEDKAEAGGVKTITFRFQILKSDEALVKKAARKVGDVSPQALAHRALMQETLRILSEPSPAQLRQFEMAMSALRGMSQQTPEEDPDDIA